MVAVARSRTNRQVFNSLLLLSSVDGESIPVYFYVVVDFVVVVDVDVDDDDDDDDDVDYCCCCCC